MRRDKTERVEETAGRESIFALKLLLWVAAFSIAARV